MLGEMLPRVLHDFQPDLVLYDGECAAEHLMWHHSTPAPKRHHSMTLACSKALRLTSLSCKYAAGTLPQYRAQQACVVKQSSYSSSLNVAYNKKVCSWG